MRRSKFKIGDIVRYKDDVIMPVINKVKEDFPDDNGEVPSIFTGHFQVTNIVDDTHVTIKSSVWSEMDFFEESEKLTYA